MRNEFKNSAFTTKEIDATVPVTSRRTRKWEVGDVLDHKKDESGDHFFVSWKGWAEKYNSWEPRSSFHSDLIEEYFLRKSAPASLVVSAVSKETRSRRCCTCTRSNGSTCKGCKCATSGSGCVNCSLSAQNLCCNPHGSTVKPKTGTVACPLPACSDGKGGRASSMLCGQDACACECSFGSSTLRSRWWVAGGKQLSLVLVWPFYHISATVVHCLSGRLL